MIYESVSSQALNESIQTILEVIVSLTALVHIYMGCVLFCSTIRSRLTKVFLYQQCFLDWLYSILVLAHIITRNFTPMSEEITVNAILCYIFQSGATARSLRIMALCNIVCQSADRFWALVYPKTYRQYTKCYAITCSVVILVYPLLPSISRIAKMAFIDGSCKFRELAIEKYKLLIIESMLRYGIPICFLLVLNAFVIRTLYQLRIITFTKHHASRHLTATCRPENGIAERTPDSLITIQNTLFLNAIFLAMAQTVSECISIVLTALDFYNIVHYDVGSSARTYHLCVVTILNCLNPIVSIITVKALRNTAVKQWEKITMIRCKKSALS